MQKNVLGKGFWSLVAVSGAIFATLYFHLETKDREQDPGKGEVIVEPPVPSPEEAESLRKLRLEEAALRADIDARYARFASNVTAICEKYRKMLPLSEAEDYFKLAEQGADFIASDKGLCGWKVSAVLAYKMAYDKVKGTHLTEAAIHPIVTDRIVQPLSNAEEVYSSWIASFRNELRKEDMAFALDIAARSHKFKESISVLKSEDANKLSDSMDGLITDIQNHAKESAITGVCTAFDLAFIKSSYAVIKNLIVRIATTSLSGVAEKMVGTAAVATTSAVADGPLPICDIAGSVITIGGLIWTACEIYKVTAAMPNSMNTGMRQAINEMRVKLITTGAENLKSDSDSCLKSADTRVHELLKLTGGENE